MRAVNVLGTRAAFAGDLLSRSIVLTEAQLRQRRNEKWAKFPADILPAWVAEMDFAAPPAMQALFERTVTQQDYGYPLRGTTDLPDDALAAAFAARMMKLANWQVDPSLVRFMAAFDQGIIALLMGLTEPGDGVIVQTPCYPPFYEVNRASQRLFIANPLRWQGERFELDLAHLNEVAKGAKALLLCNPQNPTGRVFSEAELLQVGDIAERHGLVVIADEIHSDLLGEGQRHVPFASLKHKAALNSVVLNSPSKGFNVPGLFCGVMCFGSAELAERYHERMPRRLMGHATTFGLDACITAWAEDDEWLGQVRAEVVARRAELTQAVNTRMPGVRLAKAEGTYLAWLDFSALGLAEPAHDFLLREAKVATVPGQRFAPEYAACVRLNIGTSETILAAIIDRMVAALAVRRRGR